MTNTVRDRVNRIVRLLAVILLLGLRAFGQANQIPNWWLSSDPKNVLADPLFHTLFVTQRVEILSQIDPKFAKLPFKKQDLYLWRAETANLPKASPPKQVIAWSPGDPHCTADLSYQGKLTRRIEAAGFRVQATLERHGFFNWHLRIENLSQDAVLIRPQTFVLQVIKPKNSTLYFEYPMRISWQMTKGIMDFGPAFTPTERTTVRSGVTGRTVATIDSPDQVAKQEMKDTYSQIRQWGLQYTGTIVQKCLTESTVTANRSVEGDVYFESSDKARELVLRVFIGETAFDFPFSMPKR